MTGQRNSFKAFFALIAGLSFMSFSAILIKSSHAPGIVTAFYRMGIAAVLLFIPFVYYLTTHKKALPAKGVLLAVMAGMCFGFDMSFWSTGIVASNATIPTIFANTAPLWVGVGSFFIFREKHKRGFWVGLLIAFSGIPMLLKNDFYASSNILFGALLGLTAGLFYGTYLLISQPGRELLNTLSFLFISSLSSAIVLGVFTLLFDYDFTGYDRHTVLIFILYGLGVQVIGWFLVNYSQGYIPASIVSPTLLGQPLGTAFLAVILLHEHLTLWHITGGIVIITGIYIIHFSRKR